MTNPWGATTCTYTQGFVFGNADTDPRTGFVPRDGVINTVTVKVGANPAPLRFVVLRQLTNAQLGAVSGEPKCCFFVRETDPVQPAPNTTTTFTVNLPVENNRQTNVITQDAIGFSAPAGGTLPLAFVPGQFSPATFTPGGVTSSSFHPKLGPEHGANTGGAFASGHQGGLDVLLQYTFTPAAAVVSPAVGVDHAAADRHHDDRRVGPAPDRRRPRRRAELPAGDLPRHRSTCSRAHPSRRPRRRSASARSARRRSPSRRATPARSRSSSTPSAAGSPGSRARRSRSSSTSATTGTTTKNMTLKAALKAKRGR